MTLADAVRILREHNAWRRDNTGDLEQQDPIKIGKAIDILCAFAGLGLVDGCANGADE